MREPNQPHRISRLAAVGFTTLLILCSAEAPLPAAPIISDGGIVNAASYALPGSFPASAGSIATIFGTGLASFPLAASTLPLPFVLGATSVMVGSKPAPLFYVSPTQINFQMPSQPCCSDLIWPVIVTVGTAQSTDVSLTVPAFGPAIFSVNASGSGQGAVLIANAGVFAAPTGSISGVQSRPAQRGELITIFCTGLGPVTNQPDDGFPALADPISQTLNIPSVIIGTTNVVADFAGLAPGFVGLYQVSVRVPTSAPTGNGVPVRVTLDPGGGLLPPPVTIAIQ